MLHVAMSICIWLVGWLFWVKRPFETVFQSISGRLPKRGRKRKVVVVVALLFYVHGKHHKVMSGRSVNLTTLFLGRLRPPKRLTSTSCTYFRQ